MAGIDRRDLASHEPEEVAFPSVVNREAASLEVPRKVAAFPGQIVVALSAVVCQIEEVLLLSILHAFPDLLGSSVVAHETHHIGHGAYP